MKANQFEYYQVERGGKQYFAAECKEALLKSLSHPKIQQATVLFAYKLDTID